MFLKLSKNLLPRDKIWHLTWTHCLLAFYIVTSGPAGWLELFAILLSQISYLSLCVFLHRHLGFTLRKLYVCFICRRSYIFLAFIWSSLCLLSSMYRLIPPFVTFVCSGTTWFNLRHVCCVLYMPVVSLVQARLCFWSSIWISSVASISKILRMDYRSARNCHSFYSLALYRQVLLV